MAQPHTSTVSAGRTASIRFRFQPDMRSRSTPPTVSPTQVDSLNDYHPVAPVRIRPTPTKLFLLSVTPSFHPFARPRPTALVL